MRKSLPKQLTLLNDFGRRPYRGADFVHLIDACGIELVLSDEIEKGSYYYCTVTGKHVIELSTKIQQSERAQVGWHEFAHYLQNRQNPVPMRADYCKPERRSAREKYADAFAFVCINGIQMCGRIDFIWTLMAMGRQEVTK